MKRCDGEKPVCSRCLKAGQDSCVYDDETIERRLQQSTAATPNFSAKDPELLWEAMGSHNGSFTGSIGLPVEIQSYSGPSSALPEGLEVVNLSSVSEARFYPGHSPSPSFDFLFRSNAFRIQQSEIVDPYMSALSSVSLEDLNMKL